MARNAEAILREAIGGLVMIQAQLAAQVEEQKETIEKLTAEIAVLTQTSHARTD